MKNKEDNFYQQPEIVVADKRFQTCIKYAKYITDFFEEKGIANWELGGVRTRFPIDQKFCETKHDNINPDYYRAGGIETFDFLKAKLSPSQLAGFCKGNVIKYITRADHKNKVEDLKKCRWYLDKLIEELDGKAIS